MRLRYLVVQTGTCVSVAALTAGLFAQNQPVISSSRVVDVPVTVPIRNGAVADLVVEVPATTAAGVCEHVNLPAPPPAVRTMVVAFGPKGKPTRRVSVMTDANGSVVRYSDIRGDLRAIMDPSVTPQNPLGRVTAIAIDFPRQSAVVRNQHGGAPSNAVRAVGPEVLVTDRLDNPTQTIALVRAGCES